MEHICNIIGKSEIYCSMNSVDDVQKIYDMALSIMPQNAPFSSFRRSGLWINCSSIVIQHSCCWRCYILYHKREFFVIAIGFFMDCNRMQIQIYWNWMQNLEMYYNWMQSSEIYWNWNWMQNLEMYCNWM